MTASSVAGRPPSPAAIRECVGVQGAARKALSAACAGVLLAWNAVPSTARPDARADWDRYSVLTPAGLEEPPPELLKKVRRLLYCDHKIVKGEYSAWHLAKKYGTTAMALQATKGDEMIILFPGQKVTVLNKDGMLYRARKDGETLDAVIARYNKEPRAAHRYKEMVVVMNRLPPSAMLGEHPLAKDSSVFLPSVRINFDTYRFPFESGWARISSRYGMRFHPVLGRRRMHEGIDFAKPYGTPVFASRSGRVLECGWKGGYGLVVVVKHFDGATTLYGHLSKVRVKKGQVVQRGKTLLGNVGSSGMTTGPHLHFEMRDKKGSLLNPVSKIGKR
ncbi:MAG: M23 family metallopeptidase [Elusimicrobia bacterium]|nr:M23 family metallopeptidase [Elusimicrobiota bacterium]